MKFDILFIWKTKFFILKAIIWKVLTLQFCNALSIQIWKKRPAMVGEDGITVRKWLRQKFGNLHEYRALPKISGLLSVLSFLAETPDKRNKALAACITFLGLWVVVLPASDKDIIGCSIERHVWPI